jgi:hypothetical protein
MLICRTHKTVDILPDYNTEQDMEGEHDFHLRDAIERHLGKFGADPGKHASLIMRISEDEFALLKPEKLKQAIMDDSLEEYLKSTRENYKQDALRCYELHNRPVVGHPGCLDYRNDDRAIGHTKGLSDKEKTYLCDFCPYQSYVDFHKRKAAGLYDK